MGVLYMVATPIGNLEDITARALRVLGEVSLIAAEDTRRTGALLHHFGIETPMLSYHAHNQRAREQALLAALGQGDVALVTDAGTPGVSDPGNDLAAAAAAAGFVVSPIPGPSSLDAAVSISGIVPGPFLMLGFLPRSGAERTAVLARAAMTGWPVVIFEAANRTAVTLRDLADRLGERPAIVARELTKLHEDISRGTLSELATVFEAREPRGEIVIVTGAATGDATNPDADAADARALIHRLRSAGLSASAAAKEAARVTGEPRSSLYALAMAWKPDGKDLNPMG